MCLFARKYKAVDEVNYTSIVLYNSEVYEGMFNLHLTNFSIKMGKKEIFTFFHRDDISLTCSSGYQNRYVWL